MELREECNDGEWQLIIGERLLTGKWWHPEILYRSEEPCDNQIWQLANELLEARKALESIREKVNSL